QPQQSFPGRCRGHSVFLLGRPKPYSHVRRDALRSQSEFRTNTEWMPASSGGILPSESLVGPTESQLPKLTAEAIYSELRDRICLLDLPPGAALRDQHLAEEFGVSRTPVREALAMLRLEGLAVRRAGGGTSVSTVDIKALRDVYAL